MPRQLARFFSYFLLYTNNVKSLGVQLPYICKKHTSFNNGKLTSVYITNTNSIYLYKYKCVCVYVKKRITFKRHICHRNGMKGKLNPVSCCFVSNCGLR